MNTDRPTIEWTTPGGIPVVLRTYITGREFQALKNVYVEDAKAKIDGRGGVEVEGFNPLADDKAIERMISFVVVSLSGSTENVVDRVLDLPVDDYQEIVTKIKEITDKKKA